MKFEIGDRVRVNRNIFYKGCWIADNEVYIITKLEDHNLYDSTLVYLDRQITNHSNNLITANGLISMRQEERKNKIKKLNEIQDR